MGINSVILRCSCDTRLGVGNYTVACVSQCALSYEILWLKNLKKYIKNAFADFMLQQRFFL